MVRSCLVRYGTLSTVPCLVRLVQYDSVQHRALLNGQAEACLALLVRYGTVRRVDLYNSVQFSINLKNSHFKP